MDKFVSTNMRELRMATHRVGPADAREGSDVKMKEFRC